MLIDYVYDGDVSLITGMTIKFEVGDCEKIV